MNVHPRVGYSVRLEWPDGSHSFAHFSPSADVTSRKLRSLRAYWNHSPVGPCEYAVVEISRHDWLLHTRRRGCRSPCCPG